MIFDLKRVEVVLTFGTDERCLRYLTFAEGDENSLKHLAEFLHSDRGDYSIGYVIKPLIRTEISYQAKNGLTVTLEVEQGYPNVEHGSSCLKVEYAPKKTINITTTKYISNAYTAMRYSDDDFENLLNQGGIREFLERELTEAAVQ